MLSFAALVWIANLSLLCPLFWAPVYAAPDDKVVNTSHAYWGALGETLKDPSLSSAIMWDEVTDSRWGEVINEQVKRLIWYVINIFMVVWIAIAFFGWYKIMTSNKEDALQEWIRLVIYWLLWVIIMVSAKFFAGALVWDWWLISSEFRNNAPSGVALAKNLYDKILYPFIKIALYFAIGALFFMMAAKVVWFVVSTDDAVKKKSAWVIIRSVVWILIVMWAKQLVESVMWKQDAVLNSDAVAVDEMWNPVLAFESAPIIAQTINRVMWLTMLIVVVLVIIQWYKMFAKPDDPKNRESLKKTLLYIIIGVLVIWASYIISNALVINRIG